MHPVPETEYEAFTEPEPPDTDSPTVELADASVDEFEMTSGACSAMLNENTNVGLTAAE